MGVLMDALRDRANLLLLALLMAAVVGMVLIAVLHGYSQEKLDAHAAALETNLTLCEADAAQLVEALSAASSTVNSSQQSIRAYDVLYGAAVDTLAATNASLQRTSGELVFVRLNYERSQQYASSLNTSLVQRDATIKTLGAEIIRLQQQLRSCREACPTP